MGNEDFVHRLVASWKHFKRPLMYKYFYEATIKHYYKKNFGYEPDLEHPRTFNEKTQWLKIHYRDPLMAVCADKVAVREYIKKKIGPAYLVPVYGIYKKPEEIDFASLPWEFVLKPSHSSGKVLLCTDKKSFDQKNARQVMANWLKENYYDWSGEWVYKDISPRLICEKMLARELIDYKFYCFQGEPKCLSICLDRWHQVKYATFSIDFEKMPFVIGHHDNNVELTKPENYEEMVHLARILAQNFLFVRVDFYNLAGKIYFGELTFFSNNGMQPFNPPEWDEKLGSWLDLEAIPDEYFKKD